MYIIMFTIVLRRSVICFPLSVTLRSSANSFRFWSSSCLSRWFSAIAREACLLHKWKAPFVWYLISLSSSYAASTLNSKSVAFTCSVQTKSNFSHNSEPKCKLLKLVLFNLNEIIKFILWFEKIKIEALVLIYLKAFFGMENDYPY